ncbi:DUF4329 domain-containing protein [Pseudomonas fildesensis]|uniref:DUF4329 domain-containing protein n=1 Tax=Pseudomonas fildesensis TaxID=1674920 RepID=A0A0J8G4H0_9PSED|nr:DUF4329 domain-containing protein [Pseudomonas fildesensis]KMT55864.1 hypothetical protein ACR52_09020 [Pseudomonas fildesensis]
MLTRSYRTTRASGFNPVLPPLSPPFISADDAARWAHTFILRQPLDKEYGGAILKRGGRFFATQPIPDREITFDHRILLPTDAAGDFIMPAGYTGEAYYHSHPNNPEETKRQNPSFTSDQVSTLLSFYSVPDLKFTIEHRNTARAHYLSGPDGSLLKYESSGSKEESDFHTFLIDGKQFGSLPRVFEYFIWRTAQAGDLRVVVPNVVWGGVRGRITTDWKVGRPATKVPEIQPFFTQVFARAEEAVLAAKALTQGTPAGRTLGFVLKHTGGEGYVATYPETETVPLFSPAGVFPERAPGKLRLPSNFRLEAIYYRSKPLAADIPALESWLYSLFFSPAEMVAAIVQARATLEIQNKSRGLVLYLLAEDGAWLRFQLPDAQASTELARETAAGVLDDNGAQAAMQAGTLTPRTYVRRAILAGDLSVVQPGDVWRRVGQVDNRTALLTPFYQAMLSPAFLSASDAATYAHEKIGARLDRPYGGYILKGEDGRFVVTEPMESHANPFASALFFPAGDQGPLIPPEPYAIHARYGSHTALSMVDPGWVGQRRWTREDTEINLQIFSAEEIRAVIQQGRPAYLSGGEDCLLAYAPSGSSQEALVFSSTAPQPGGSSLQQRLDRGLTKPAQWVVGLAESGDLRIIQGNRLWGPRSPVYSDWTPHFTYADREGPPDFITYGAIFSTADAAARDLHMRVHGRNLAAQSCFAFILKHAQHEQYIATQVVGVDARSKLFRRGALFAQTEKGYVFPEGFALRGLFRSQQWKASGLASANAWLTRFFVVPAVLYSALYDALRWGELYNAGDNLPLYFSTEEGALLRYRMPGPFAFGSGGALEKELESTQAALASGAKTPLDFVREWAKRGQLNVVRTSQCWGDLGAVSEGWQSYATIVRRRLTPMFAEPDDAVRHVRRLIGIGRQRAYGGVLLRLGNGLFTATEPLAVPPQGFALNWIYPDQAVVKGLYPENATLVARYRSVVERELPTVLSAPQKAIYTSMVPTSVLSNLLNREVHIKREYLIGPTGTLLSYSLTDSDEEQRLKVELAPLDLVKGDAGDNLIERQIRNGELLPADFVSRVAKAGDLRVIEGSEVWGPPRRLIGEFVAFTYQSPGLLIRGAQADPEFSPIFTQADDAVRSVLPEPGLREGLAFGYLFKSTKKQHYMVTLPLQRQSYARFEQVFPYAQLPQGYAIEGVYLCASNAAIAKADDTMARSFFWPQEIADGLNFVKKPANGGYWPLYLLCADNALLKFRFDGRDSSLMFSSEAASLRRSLLAGSLKVLDYVRSLSANGMLDVLRPSAIWASRGRITTVWQPGAEALTIEGSPEMVCGPVCAHPDDAARHSQGLFTGFTGKTYLGGVLKVATTNDVCALIPLEEAGNTILTVQALFSDGGGVTLVSSHPSGYYKVIAVQSFYKAMTPLTGTEVFDSALRENFIAEVDLKAMLDTVKINAPSALGCYFIGRGGALLKYLPTDPAAEHMLAVSGANRSASQLISKLRESGKLLVLETDAFWTRLGSLGDEWQVKDVQAEPDPESILLGRDKDEL